MTGDELRTWCKNQGWTQEKLAAELGITARQIRRYESGDRTIPRMLELALLTFIHVPKRHWPPKPGESEAEE